jgi:3'-phosphoadenosine 5'-phosphosulfate sulfotransferase (PAPS reductase)/FAD synthetase
MRPNSPGQKIKKFYFDKKLFWNFAENVLYLDGTSRIGYIPCTHVSNDLPLIQRGADRWQE